DERVRDDDRDSHDGVRVRPTGWCATTAPRLARQQTRADPTCAGAATRSTANTPTWGMRDDGAATCSTAYACAHVARDASAETRPPPRVARAQLLDLGL